MNYYDVFSKENMSLHTLFDETPISSRKFLMVETGFTLLFDARDPLDFFPHRVTIFDAYMTELSCDSQDTHRNLRVQSKSHQWQAA